MRFATPKSKAIKSPIQRKLKIGQPGDKYEREADSMADKVMSMSSQESPILRKCQDCEGETVQMHPFAASISPLIQTQAIEEEEEMLQMQPLEEEEEMLQPKADGNLPDIQKNEISSELQSSDGTGSNMPHTTTQFMSSAFGADFSNVQIHTDQKAEKLNQSLNSRAFTHGNNIYFNKGEYQPNSSKGKRLLAHELTHTIQQGKSSTIRAKKKPAPKKKDVKIHDFFIKKSSACACLMHIHNDERNSKAVARLLNDKCNYNLIDIKDSKASSRGLNKALKIKNEKGKTEFKTDPNEIFSPEIIRSCFVPAEKKKLKKAGFAVDEICALFKDMTTCSDNFNLPVVALHNNTELSNKKDKKKALAESTNIYRWAVSKAIKKTVIDDPANPDRVVWATNEKDYDKLKKSGGVNTALGDEKFRGDTDLSTLFGVLPEMAVKLGDAGLTALAKKLGIDPETFKKLVQAFIASQLRYINIETEHKKNVYDQSLAEVNLEFVHKVLSKLGLWCCDKTLTISSLKKDLKEIKKPSKKKAAK